MNMTKYHVPVLQEETIALLAPKSGEHAIDGTLGDGGHAERILEATGPKGKLLGIDLDPRAIETARERLQKFGSRAIFTQGNFSSMEEIVERENFEKPSIILLDLGLRAGELEESGRGFSFKRDEPLDMRFDPSGLCTAAGLVNGASKEELVTILRSFGEEPLAQEIVERIVFERRKEPITTTGRLTEIILSAYRMKLRSKKEVPWIGGIHPATRAFQALRIRTNDELEHLRTALPQTLRMLAKGGKLAVLSFHSLEDRIVKKFFKEQGTKIKILTKKPITPGEEEIKANKASRSAKLRVIQKIT